jgi:hypothetical protein
MTHIPLRHGVFPPPFHPMDENRAACPDRDLERTRSIRFSTGVISFPHHNPLMVANRIIQLDHHTRGHRDKPTEKRSAAARAMSNKHEAEQRVAQTEGMARPPGRPNAGREAW